MDQQLTALSTLLGDQDLVPSTHIVVNISKSNIWGSDILFWPYRHCLLLVHTHTCKKNIHTYKNVNFLKENYNSRFSWWVHDFSKLWLEIQYQVWIPYSCVVGLKVYQQEAICASYFVFESQTLPLVRMIDYFSLQAFCIAPSNSLRANAESIGFQISSSLISSSLMSEMFDFFNSRILLSSSSERQPYIVLALNFLLNKPQLLGKALSHHVV